jgi:hypothetical protein
MAVHDVATVSFDDGCTDAQAMARLEEFVDDLEAETVRRYAANLLLEEPDIDAVEFQGCVAQSQAAIARFRAETRDERREMFRQIDAARRPAQRVPVRERA